MKNHRTEEMEALRKRWALIQNMGGPKVYIEQELRKKGVLRVHRPILTELRTDREKNEAIAAYRAEYSERRKLRAFVWEAYKAVHITHLGLDIFWTDILEDDFFDPFERKRRIEDSDLPMIESIDQLILCLKEAVPELDLSMLRWFAYHRDVAKTCHYKQFSIPKKTGGHRQIWAPKEQLKSLQRWILENIVERMPIHGAAHGFVPGRSIVSNAEEHVDSALVVNLDLENFFPSFSFRRVKGIFRAAGYMEGIATILALLCTEAPRYVLRLEEETLYVAKGKRCLPQGSPASPMLTNVACMRLDRRLAGYAEKNGWRYSRYADDLSFSVPQGSKASVNIKKLMSYIQMVVAEEGLRIHPEKTSVRGIGQRQEVTGLIVNGKGRPRVPKELKKRMRAALYNAQQGRELQGENIKDITQMMGYGAFVYATSKEEGRVWIEAFQKLL